MITHFLRHYGWHDRLQVPCSTYLQYINEQPLVCWGSFHHKGPGSARHLSTDADVSWCQIPPQLQSQDGHRTWNVRGVRRCGAPPARGWGRSAHTPSVFLFFSSLTVLLYLFTTSHISTSLSPSYYYYSYYYSYSSHSFPFFR